MKNEKLHNLCSEAWSMITGRDYRNWNGLPHSCSYSDFDAAFSRLRDEYGLGTLGSANRRVMYRTHIANGYPDNLKVWFQENSILLIEIKYPILPYPSEVVLEHFGPPDIKLDYQLDIMPVSHGAWVYPNRGLTLFLDSSHTKLMGIALFHSCNIAYYLEQLHPGGNHIDEICQWAIGQ